MLRSAVLVMLIAIFLGATPAHAGNDDSCDIGIAPAATLLLPYFEVDFVSPPRTARTTIFAVTNVSARPQIAHVTLWTDWAYAALTFNIHLTPYGVQSINLYDVFSRGAVAPDRAAELTRQRIINLPPCAHLPTQLPQDVLHDLREIFTTGRAGTQIGRECTSRLGGTHPN